MVFEIRLNTTEPRQLTRSVLQIIALLDMYQAELARVLQLQCADIGELSSAQRCLDPGSRSWKQAQLFVRFYQLLYDRMSGDGVAMRHWLRVRNDVLGNTPHLLIVDEGRLEEVVGYLEDMG
jgi:hypothetical protein